MIFYLLIIFTILIGAMISFPTPESLSVGIPLLIVMFIFPLIFRYNLKNKKIYINKKQVNINRKKTEEYYNEFGELP